MDISQLYGATWQHDMVTYRLCRVVWNIKVVKPTGSYYRATYDDTDSVPLTLIVTNWAAERSFTSVNVLIHTGEWPFSCSVCNYQCRRDCDLKRHMRRQVAYRSRCSTRPLWSSEWPIDHNSFLFVSSHIYTINCSHLQPISICFYFNLFFIHCILIAVNDINWAPSLKELSERMYTYTVGLYKLGRSLIFSNTIQYNSHLPGFRTGVVLHCFISWLMHAF